MFACATCGWKNDSHVTYNGVQKSEVPVESLFGVMTNDMIFLFGNKYKSCMWKKRVSESFGVRIRLITAARIGILHHPSVSSLRPDRQGFVMGKSGWLHLRKLKFVTLFLDGRDRGRGLDRPPPSTSLVVVVVVVLVVVVVVVVVVDAVTVHRSTTSGLYMCSESLQA